MPESASRTPLGWALLATVLLGIWAVYARILDAPHIFDDASIWSDLARRMPSLGWETLRTASSEVHHEPHRWVTNASFALNFYLYGEGTRSFHVTNVAIHCAVTLAVFGFTRETLRLAGRAPESAFWVALTTAALFAFNPMQTQAVSYIWQRATALVALFSIGSMWLFAAGLARHGRTRIFLFAGSFLLIPLAMFSKQNGVMTPVMMALYTWLFASKRRLSTLAGVSAVALAIAAVLFHFVGPLWLDTNDVMLVFSWNWSSWESLRDHLLTQARMVLRLASLLLAPFPSRLNIDHYVDESSGWLTPWTTLPSVMLVIALVAGALAVARRRPLVAFGILWWFVMLLTETTLLRLGPIFEYRAYLPGVGPLLLIALGIEHLASGSARRARLAVAGATALVLLLGAGASVRNEVFTSRFALWEDAARKAPENPRTWWNLGAAWEEEGRRWPPNSDERVEAWDRAEESYGSALRVETTNTFYRHGMARFLMYRGGATGKEPLPADATPALILEVLRPGDRTRRLDEAALDSVHDALWISLRRSVPSIQLIKEKEERPDPYSSGPLLGYSLRASIRSTRVIRRDDTAEVHCEVGATIRTWYTGGHTDATARARVRGANNPDSIARTTHECLASATSSLAGYSVVTMLNRLAWFELNHGAEFPPPPRPEGS